MSALAFFLRPLARPRCAALLLFLALSATLARAQSVAWSLADQGSLMTAVQLVFEGCIPDGDPDLPAIPNGALQYAGSSNNTSIVNGRMSQSVSLVYIVRPRGSSPVQIPSFDVNTNRGRIRVAAFAVPGPSTSVDTIAGAKLLPQQSSVWAGEVFGLLYELSASRQNNPQINPTFEWNPAPLVAEDWSKYEFTERVVNGARRAFVTFRTRAIARHAGSLKLEAATHLLNIQTGTVASFFGPSARMEQVAVTSDQPVIEVKPLPAPPAGFAGFNGAVGQFKLASKVVPEKAAVGEPVTWTLELTGIGNWPDVPGLPARTVSNDFRVVQPKAKRTPTEAKLFDVALAEDVVLVPTKPGTYTLGPVEFTYFDPKLGTYQKQTVAAVPLAIAAPAASQFNVTPPPTIASTTQNPEPKPQNPPPKTPPPPATIPRDPLPGFADTPVPLSRLALTLWLASAALAVLAFWLWLAVGRARATDPLRPRREARDRLARTLTHLQTATGADRAALILSWQRDTRTLFQIHHAAPPATALEDAAWSTLWAESERALYRASTDLPADWIARAQEALAAKRLPGFRATRLFLPQNLMPFAAALALLFITSAAVVTAAELDGTVSYRKGDFAAAEKTWRAIVQKLPTNWIARHNLSLALAQQERSAEAAAHAAAAFVQQPSHAAVRWQFQRAAERSGFAAPELSAFLQAGPRQSLAALLSPGAWHRVMIASAFLATLALAVLLWNAYRRSRRFVLGSAVAALAIAFVLFAGAVTSFLTYGLAANPDALIVARSGTLRSIPTEAEIQQKTSPLAPGALATTDKSFLEGRWLRLVFENGQTGWVRKEDVVPLWQ